MCVWSELIVRPSLKSLVVLLMFAFHFSLWSRPFQLWSWPLPPRMISGLKPKQPQKRILDSSTERHTFGSLTLINFISKTIAHMAKHNGNDDFRIHIHYSRSLCRYYIPPKRSALLHLTYDVSWMERPSITHQFLLPAWFMDSIWTHIPPNPDSSKQILQGKIPMFHRKPICKIWKMFQLLFPWFSKNIQVIPWKTAKSHMYLYICPPYFTLFSP